MNVAIIGGGAAGFFAALSCKHYHPAARVTIYEKTSKLLAKVKVSGGGRCNVMHDCFTVSQLVKHYPRGGKALKKPFAQFGPSETRAWFEQRSVPLRTEADGRMFPKTNTSQTIIDCFLQEAQRLGVIIRTQSPVHALQPKDDIFQFAVGQEEVIADRVIVATGGSPKRSGLDWLADLGHAIAPPVPSLFTFNMPDTPLTALPGLSVERALVRVPGTKLSHDGPLLITHWGTSGPAVLKLSAWGARTLSERAYQFPVQINWLGNPNEEAVRTNLFEQLPTLGGRKLANKNPYRLPQRLWNHFLAKSDIDPDTPWAELSKKRRNALLTILLNDSYAVSGKTTFKEEFVTCGGVRLSDVDMNTLESRVCPGLYFAGEVLDIDGVTGGFNFQAAWSTGFVAGKLGGNLKGLAGSLAGETASLIAKN
ncbi:MAG: NAD(P)/FAD-dependent oxidoreductase [Tunicatimonas sp.]